MTTEAERQTVLARKLRLERDREKDKPRSFLRALRLGLARGASEIMNLPISVIGARHSCRELDELPQVLPGGQLYLILSSPEGQRAAACIDPECVGAIIQQQTTGQVTSGETAGRRYTGTDAAMVAPLLEGALSRALDLVEAAEDRFCLSGFEYVARVEDPGGVTLALEQERYRVCELTVDLAGGQRQGCITLVLPERAAPKDPVKNPASSPSRRLDQAAAVIRADLMAVIDRMQFPLSSLAELRVGDTLPLAGNRLSRIHLLTIERHAIATGRLGQCDGMRAVRLREHPSEGGLSQGINGTFRQHEAAATGKGVPPAVVNPDATAGRGTVPAGPAGNESGNSGIGTRPGSGDQQAAEPGQVTALSEPADLTGPGSAAEELG